MNKKLYLDNSATTNLSENVKKVMIESVKRDYKNPSSFHQEGFVAKKALNDARKIIAKELSVSEQEVYFTSGGSESVNWALKGVAFANEDKGKHILVSSIEHPCSRQACEWLKKRGFEVEEIPVNKEGFVSVEDVNKHIREDTILVSVMHANNEIGSIQDIKSIANICEEKKVYFHSDACQSFTRVDINLKKIPLSLLSINSHKVFGPKGVGALIIRKGVKIDSLIHGGGQENNFRGGTQNVLGIIGFAQSVKEINKEDVAKTIILRNEIISRVLKTITDVNLNGPVGDNRLCNNIHFSFKRVEGEAIGGLLDEKGIMVSTGSACSSQSLDPSHVLTAIGLSHEDMNGSLRISIDSKISKEDIDYFVKELINAVNRLRKISALQE